MTSPFDSANSIITMYLEPILHPHFNSYINVITLSSMPSGPLSDMVKVMNFPKLSPFQQVGRFASPFATSATCIHTLLRYPKKSLISFLATEKQKYIIDPTNFESNLFTVAFFNLVFLTISCEDNISSLQPLKVAIIETA